MRLSFLHIPATLLLFSHCSFTPSSSASNISGQYDFLALAYNSQTDQITGSVETGSGEGQNGGPLATCEFYIEGKLVNHVARIKTYWQPDASRSTPKEVNYGTLTISGNKITTRLKDNPGGCMTVGLDFKKGENCLLDKKQNWLEIKYITSNKSFFYSSNNEATKRKAYLLKGDLVYISRIEGNWLYCTYMSDDGRKTEGWIKVSDVNVIK